MLLISCKNSWHPENPSCKMCNILFAKCKQKNKWEEAPHTKLRDVWQKNASVLDLHLHYAGNLTWLNSVGCHSTLCHMLGLLAVNGTCMLGSKKSPAHMHKQRLNLSWGYSSLVHFLLLCYILWWQTFEICKTFHLHFTMNTKEYQHYMQTEINTF